MTTENKKIAMYFGGAVLVGAVGYFVYSFFQKKTIDMPITETTPTDYSTVFSGMQTDFAPIVKPTLIADETI
jgi:hypothetical protein